MRSKTGMPEPRVPAAIALIWIFGASQATRSARFGKRRIHSAPTENRSWSQPAANLRTRAPARSGNWAATSSDTMPASSRTSGDR